MGKGVNNMSKSYLGDKDVFSANLVHYIEKSHLTQKEVAKKIGVTESSITDWVTKRHYPRLDKIQLLAEVFGIKMTDLVEPPELSKKSIGDKEQLVLDLFHKIPDGNKEIAIKMLQTLIDNE
jgi:transcriptional regulator with XRE-family HTH domain